MQAAGTGVFITYVSDYRFFPLRTLFPVNLRSSHKQCSNPGVLNLFSAVYPLPASYNKIYPLFFVHSLALWKNVQQHR